MLARNPSRTKVRVAIPRRNLAAFCQRWKVSELALFGSVLRSDFRATSDVDLLVSFSPNARISLLDLVRMQNGLKEIFGRDVDLVERRAIERSRNYIRRKSILENTQVIYAARQALRFMKGVNREEFQDNELIQNAVMRPLEIIGEASAKISSRDSLA